MLSEKYLAADGIENCIKVLDEIENGTLNRLEFVELNACVGGCVGGTLNVENPFIAKARLRSLRKYLPISRNRVSEDADIPEDVFLENTITSDVSDVLSEDRITAIAKMAKIEEIYKRLPHLDCGSCGAPNCHALSEDIIKGDADITDCLITMRKSLENKTKVNLED